MQDASIFESSKDSHFYVGDRIVGEAMLEPASGRFYADLGFLPYTRVDLL